MKYKNISGKDLAIPGVGVVEAGKEIESETEIVNQNLKRVERSGKSFDTKPVDEDVE